MKTEPNLGKGLRVKAGLALLLALAAGLIVQPSPKAAAAEGDTAQFKFFKMELSGTRHDRVLLDINGDRLADLGMIFSRSDKRNINWFRTCLLDKAAGFSKCSELTLPREARAVDVGEVDGKPGAEMVVLTNGGVLISTFAGGQFGPFKKVLGEAGIFSGTELGDHSPAVLHCLWDLNGDGKKELVLPTVAGPAIYTYAEPSFTLFQKINSPVQVTYRVGSLGDITHTDDVNQFLRWQNYEQRTTAHYTVPDVFVVDFNGDKKLDIVTLIENTVKVFAQAADGKFSSAPVATVKKSILAPAEKGVGFAGEAMTFAELNGDGLWDIIMMKWGSSEERTQMDRYIYYARPGLKYPEPPDQIVRSENAAVDFGIHDLNKDGKQDLVIPFFHFAPAQAFKVMTENSIKVQFRIFLMQANGRYAQEEGKTFTKVDRRVLLNYKIDILGLIFDFKTLIEGKFHPLIDFGHDFNADGYADLIADTGGDKLTFYWGNAQVNFAAAPNLSLDFESAMDFDLVDLNGDRKTDVVAYYESAARTQKKREIAKKARQQGAAGPEPTVEEAALATAPEGTRIKVLLSK